MVEFGLTWVELVVSVNLVELVELVKVDKERHKKITRRTTTSERNKFLQVIASFRKKKQIASHR